MRHFRWSGVCFAVLAVLMAGLILYGAAHP